jgi:hypothetical protein
MAKLLSGTRIYGNATVDTFLVVSANTASSNTTTGAITVSGGMGLLGNIYLGGNLIASGNVTGNAATFSNLGNSIIASGNVTAANVIAINAFTTTGNVVAGNLNVTGNITGTLNSSTSLPNSGVTAATYGNATIVPVITVDAKGRITSASNVVITASGGGGSDTLSTIVDRGNTSSNTILLTNTSNSLVASGNVTAANVNVNNLIITRGNVFFGNAQITVALGVGTAPGNVTGEIRAANNIIAYYSSDRKFKENVHDIENAVDKVIHIGGKTFDWTNDYILANGGEDGYFVKKEDFGVIAQDVQEVFPLAVRTKTDGTLAVDYEKLSALAFAAIKELKAQIDELKKGKG